MELDRNRDSNQRTHRDYAPDVAGLVLFLLLAALLGVLIRAGLVDIVSLLGGLSPW